MSEVKQGKKNNKRDQCFWPVKPEKALLAPIDIPAPDIADCSNQQTHCTKHHCEIAQHQQGNEQKVEDAFDKMHGNSN
jgi:hypothetical protein